MKTLTSLYFKEVFLTPHRLSINAIYNTLQKRLPNNNFILVLFMVLVIMFLFSPVLYQENINLASLHSTVWKFGLADINLFQHTLPPVEENKHIFTENGLYLLPENEETLLDFINSARMEEGLQPYIWDEKLTTFARMKGEDMLLNNYIEHYSPTLGRPGDLAARNGFKFSVYGENLAGTLKASSLPPDVAFHHLMLSEHHRGAILSKKNTHIGIGVVKGKETGVVYVMHFVL